MINLTPIPESSSAAVLEDQRYLRCAVMHTSPPINSSLVAAVRQQVEPVAMFLYRDMEVDSEASYDPEGYTLEVVLAVKSNEEIKLGEERIEDAVAEFPADVGLSEVLTSEEFQALEQTFRLYRV